ncbi:MAG: MBL fold metallo-hydrolase [Actinobacteria bacterium]|nr:MAG: MBL fold metallo-hydrolase [Actinomycetota bacterium]
MRLTKFSHACVRAEGDGVLVIDPGTYSERAALDGVDAVLITHEHADHMDVDALTDALAKRPAVRIFAPADVVPKLGDLGSATTAVAAGDEFTAAGFAVRACGGQHALIHPDIPRIANLGYLLDGRVYHPGDSFDTPGDAEIDTLFVPVVAPWLKASEAIDFIRAVRPRNAYALHDALLNDAYANLLNGLLTGMAGTGYRRLGAGESLSV